jgi:hypothetical protein
MPAKVMIAVACVLAGCSDEETKGRVQVDVYEGTGEATVLFFEPSGTMVSRQVTQNLRAAADVPAGGSVLTFSTLGFATGVTWILDAQPGDQLTVRSDDYVDRGQTQIQVDPVPPDTKELRFVVPCGRYSYPQSQPISPTGVYDVDTCGSPFDLAVYAIPNAGPTAPAAATFLGVQPDAFHDARLSPTWATPQTIPVTLAGDPERWAATELELDGMSDSGAIFELPYELRVYVYDGAATPVQLAWLPGLGAAGVVVAESPGHADAGGSLRMERRFDDVSQGVTFDADPLALPAVTHVAASATGLSWSVVGKGSYDAVLIYFGGWRILAPPGTTRIARPRLPADLASFWPNENSLLSVTLLKEDGLAGWGDVRRRPWVEVDAYGRDWLTRSHYRSTSEAFPVRSDPAQ